jgi:hypothetical protein
MAGPLDGLVTVTIIATNAAPQLPNFGTPALVAYHTHNTDFVRTYTNLSGMVTDSFATTEPAYLWASTILSQTPSVPSFKIIRGSTAAAQTQTFKVVDTSTGDSVGFSMQGVNGVVADIHRTNPGGETAIQIATAIAALAAANGTTMASGGTDTVTNTTTVAGKVAYVSLVKGGNYTDTTAASTPATDLNNALTVDTSFYGVTSEHMDATNILAMAVWAEANKRMNIYTTADTAAKGAGTGIGNTLKAAGYTYSFGQWGGMPAQYGAAALESQRFTAKPGTDTWAYKQLAGVTADALTPTEITNLNGNNLNYYLANVAGVNITLNGIDASGLYADLRRGIDALAAQIQIQVYLLLLSLPKVPYDPIGIAMVGAEVQSALQQFTATPNAPAALLRGDPGFAPIVILPDIKVIPAIDRATRVLKNVLFVAYAQNAVQTVQINGVVNI